MNVERYSARLREGWTPVWTGAMPGDHGDTDSDIVLVKVAKGSAREFWTVRIPTLDTERMRVLKKRTALDPGSDVSDFPGGGKQSIVRRASIAGISPFSSPGYGIPASSSAPPDVTVVGLDIEQSIASRYPDFPMPHDPLLSIAIVTETGRFYCGYVGGYHDVSLLPASSNYEIVPLGSSTALADWAIDVLIRLRPDFVAVHNGYSYDVRVLAAHCSAAHRDYFVEVNLGKSDKGYDITIPGVTMIDTYRYLDKLHRSEYTSLSLDNLAQVCAGIPKSKQPSLRITEEEVPNMTEIIYYNVHDAGLHILVARETRCLEELISVCGVFKCPLSDAARFITGTMVATMISSYALSQGAVIDWSSEAWPADRYEGALVLPPQSGFYKDVHVMDVGAMYPNIMIDCNISIETVRSIDHAIRGWSERNVADYRMTQDEIRTSKAHRETRVSWSDSAIVVIADGMISSISRSKQGAVVEVLKHLIASRKAVGKATPRGWAFKIATNSIYGALGASTSKLQCYRGAGAVTACGRVITSLASAVSEALGFEVIYGDTDSVFVSPRHDRSKALGPEGLLAILHRILDFTPFGSIRLEHEKTYTSFISIKRKMYYGTKVSPQGDIAREVKGIAAARKDRIPIVRELITAVCNLICDLGPAASFPKVAAIVDDFFARVKLQRYDMKDSSVEKRKAGMSYYVFTDSSGDNVWLRADQTESHKSLASKEWIMKQASNALDPVLKACGLPLSADMHAMAQRCASRAPRR